MPSFSRASIVNLESCHSDLQRVLNTAIQWFDFAVICGHRGEVAQTEAFLKGASKLEWPNSMHNEVPSMAVDVIPYPVDWKDEKRFGLMVGRIMQVADEMGVLLRWGGDWDRDTMTRDQYFHDLPHLELVR